MKMEGSRRPAGLKRYSSSPRTLHDTDFSKILLNTILIMLLWSRRKWQLHLRPIIDLHQRLQYLDGCLANKVSIMFLKLMVPFGRTWRWNA